MTAEYRLVRGIGTDYFSGQPSRPAVTVDPGNFAHGVWTAVAMTLAEPLRKAFADHLDEHGCSATSGPTAIGGFGKCPEAMRLFELQPEGDKLIVG